MSPSKSKSEHKRSFEHSVRRLEEIVDALERGDVPLDDALKLYEEGIKLSKACIDKLAQAELRLKKLSKDVEGSFHLVDDESDSEG